VVGDGLRLVAAPARHFSGRGLLDRNRTLWASWALVGPRHRVFFGGDSGAFPGVAEIGERLGPFDVTLLDVGAYGDAWPQVHMTPEEAVAAHRALRGGLLVPIHWAAFDLSTHAWTEPVERLLAAAQAAGVPVAVPPPGGSVTPGESGPVARWWPELPWRRGSAPPAAAQARSAAAATEGGHP
jgi:L-ascorbate metabolism protein UlaG (beta-lactamase superfamily)